jgi:uncharacterized protein YidB (DUF937 family)
MGLLDKIVSMFGSNVPGVEAHGGLFDQVVGLINNPEIGGLPGLIAKFEKGGLGDVVSSWVGTGANAPVSGDQITNTLGADKIQEIAGKLGISNTQVSGGLAALLPHIIDKLTPDGKVPDGSVLEQALSAFSQKFMKD